MTYKNDVTFSGFVNSSDLSFTPSGMAVLKVRFVNSRNKKNDAGEWESVDPLWLNAVMFRDAAERTAERIGKGDRVIVNGRLKADNYEDKNGNKRTSFEVIADSIIKEDTGYDSGSKPAVNNTVNNYEVKSFEPVSSSPNPFDVVV